MDNDYIKKAIECIVFISDKPVTVDNLMQVFPDKKKSELKKLLAELSEMWDGMARGFKLVEVAGGFQFRTDPEYADDLANYNKKVRKFRLSKAALEVLAIAAYKQPVTRTEIDQIRGVDSSGVVSLLLDRRLLHIKGRKEVIGRPFLYGTTDEFLEVFNLKSLNDLPTLKELDEISSNIAEPPTLQSE